MQQKRAIIDPSEKILCIAGAGAGKTTVLTKRIEFLNKHKKIRGDEILAITFTRKAREEMQRRLEKIGVRTNVETFNSFCEKILLKNGAKIYGRKVRLAGYHEKMILFLSALDYIGLDLPKAVDKYFNLNQKKNKTPQQLQNILMNDCFSVLDYIKLKGKEISETKNELQKTTEYKMIYDIVSFLKKQMEIQGLRTYADQMQDAVCFFKQYPKQIPKFKHILVDEYQDVNQIQVELLDLLAPENIFAVGDPRQAIFGWRGADIRFILDFKKKYNTSKIIHLTKNYRSNEHIVTFMNKIISSMKMPDLESNFSGEKYLELKKFDSEEEELNFISQQIKNSKVPLKEIFILARTNRQLEELGKLFKKEGIPYILRTEESTNIENKGEITLATIHSIKGLEADMVFLIGANAINFPCKASEHPIIEEIKMYDYDKEEEERRLFYVAISRAKNKLILTYSGKKPTYFLNEKDFY
jgi:DNA helicase-2/ATP-dependent DNA helicase PcrA